MYSFACLSWERLKGGLPLGKLGRYNFPKRSSVYLWICSNCTDYTSVHHCTVSIYWNAHLLVLGMWPQNNEKTWSGELFSFRNKKNNKTTKATKQYFEVIHFIIVAYEGASNRAVANGLHLSCLARSFILDSLFFLFLPLALPFWYWGLQLCSWTAVHYFTDPSFSRVT